MTIAHGTVENDVLVVTLNRPAKLNALNGELARDVSTAIAGQDFRALVVTGSDRAFSAGADLAEGATGWMGVMDTIAALHQPTFAAIEGWCLGGGLELALCCDFRVAAEDARLGTPEVLRGIFPGGGGTSKLPKLIGPSRAKELMFFGDHIDPATALQWGLVNRVVPKGFALQTATELAARLAHGAGRAIALIKSIVDDGCELPIDQAVALERSRGGALRDTEDSREGVRAFLEKRRPVFRNR